MRLLRGISVWMTFSGAAAVLFPLSLDPNGDPWATRALGFGMFVVFSFLGAWSHSRIHD